MNRTSKIAQRVVRKIVDRLKESHGGDPNDWYPHKYTPAPEDSLRIRNNVPVGHYSEYQLLLPPSLSTDRSPKLNSFEIEAALHMSDLTATEVEHAMNLLPDMEAFYGFLEKEGESKTLLLVRLLLSYGGPRI